MRPSHHTQGFRGQGAYRNGTWKSPHEKQRVIAVMVSQHRQGRTLGDICRYLEQRKILTRTGLSSWSPRMVKLYLNQSGEMTNPGRRHEKLTSVPYGYTKRVDGAVTPLPREQRIVQKILRWRRQKLSLRDIQARLVTAKIVTRYGKAEWSVSVIRGIVQRANMGG